MIGFALLPGSLIATVLGGWIGRLSDRLGNRVMIQWATLTMAIGFLLISTFVGLSPFLIVAVFILVYLGYSSIQSGVSSFLKYSLLKK
jgi:DHA2 family metal-tetracycline-proton antiporter-like MFS transporter